MSKPKLTEAPDGNIFAVVGACRKCLKKHSDKATLAAFKAEVERAMGDGETDYHGMLAICQKYVEFDFDTFSIDND
jgi:hypothetical protein